MGSSADSGGGEGVRSEEYESVATREQLLQSGGRLQVQVQQRNLALIAHRQRIYAIDATCYHMGGPLLHAGLLCVELVVRVDARL